MENASALRAVGKVEVPVTVRLGEMSLPLEEILELRPGATLRFPQPAGGPAALEVDAAPIGEGEVVERSGRLGFRLQSLAGGGERLAAAAASEKPAVSPPSGDALEPPKPQGAAAGCDPLGEAASETGRSGRGESPTLDHAPEASRDHD